MTESSSEEISSKRKDFICGVVEGFYGRPWTTEQRKDLFHKIKKWGMDMYVYAPKDDYKHRAYWRELYTVEEAEHLTSLITAAKAQGITFCYALSPGLDITYSCQKEITHLKRKLEQVSQFGCTCFALLFDDIEPEMSESDKQIFQSFAHAQVSITNEMHQHLGCPKFLLCPTQYCSTRAVPTVNTSEYLNTLGTKLSQEIDIMWTGPKVISKTLTPACIEEITHVLRRPPVIWDNLHANDYDQKRLFLGPYCGRSPELIPLLRGVLTNPNCEYNANMVPIRTLAHWASCSLDAPAGLEAVSWDIKLEREGEQGVCDDEPLTSLNKHVYHHRQALRQAINEWLPEFSIPKAAQGPVIKPQPPVTVPPVGVLPMLPILPSVNTCMSLTATTPSTTTTTTSAMPAMPNIPTVHTAQLRALADVCTANSDSTLISPAESFNPVSNPIMNSLVSPTKVVLNESLPNPIIPIASCNMSIPSEIPVSTLPVPIVGLKNLETSDKNDDQAMVGNSAENSLVNDSILEGPSFIDDVVKDGEEDHIIVDDLDPIKVDEMQHNGNMSVGDTPQTLSPRQPSLAEISMEALDGGTINSDIMMTDGFSENGSMQVEPSSSPVGSDMLIEPPESSTDLLLDQSEDLETQVNTLTADDLVLFCDLFYLPFEHGARGLRILHDFHWLTTHAGTMPKGADRSKPEASEWRRRRCRFAWWCARARRLARRLQASANRELAAELHPYVWELCAVLALLDGYVRWLELGKFPSNIASHTQNSYSWFAKGWRASFESGVQEPWVFRGGLIADLRRLLPLECGSEPLPPSSLPRAAPLTVRPYCAHDEEAVCEICHHTCRDGSDCTELFPSDLQTLPADRLVAPFLTLTPEFCMVLEDDSDCFIERDISDSEPNDNDEQIAKTENKINGKGPQIMGYACAALNCKEFYKKQEIAWIPEMCRKYPASLIERDDLSPAAKECIRDFHTFSGESRAPECVVRVHPSLVHCGVKACKEPLAAPRLLTCLLAALWANGAVGVHACINSTDHFLHQFYTKLGFVEVYNDTVNNRVYLGRGF